MALSTSPRSKRGEGVNPTAAARVRQMRNLIYSYFIINIINMLLCFVNVLKREDFSSRHRAPDVWTPVRASYISRVVP